MIRESEKTLRKALNLFLMLFLLFGGIMGGMVAIFYQTQLDTLLTDLKARESGTVELQSRLVGDEFDSIVSDLLVLADLNELKEIINAKSSVAIANTAAEYRTISAYKKEYDQIRYLDEEGQEVVRVNYNNGHPFAVPQSRLQNKSKRYYFSDAFRLKLGEIFISPMDLNIEQGKIEYPLKPMIRFGTPVFDAAGSKRGIVLINYLAKALLDIVRGASTHDQGRPMLLNNEGYWLLSDTPEDEWGFMFKDRSERSFARDFPKEWAHILTTASGQLVTGNGLFTYNKIYPLQEGFQSSSGSSEPYSPSVERLNPTDYYWVLLSYIPSATLHGHIHSIQFRLFLLGAGLFIGIALGGWFLALAITKRRIYQSQLISMALYDTLTGLPNRKLFFDNLEAGIEHAQRHKRHLGLLYIDLDGFKEVNDTYGHEAGDELLIKVSKIMRSTSRKSDTVARLGGDEFAIILFEINSSGDVMTVGDKIISALRAPIKIKAGTVSIGASIGAAVCPDISNDPEELVKAADHAMYRSKAKGKNTCTMVEEHAYPLQEQQAAPVRK